MQRDSLTTSIWEDKLPTTLINNIPASDSFDVVIIGAGITGLSLGLLLLQQNKTCLILERHSVGFGTTSGTTAHINTVLDTPYFDIIKSFGKEEAQLVAQGAKEALALIRKNTETLQIDCDFESKDAWIIAANKEEEDYLNDLFESIKGVGIDVAYNSKIPIPLDYTKSIRNGEQAQFHPTQYINGLRKTFEARGGIILEQHTVTEVKREKDTLSVITPAQTFEGKDVVYATHIPPGINILHTRCAPYRSYVLSVELENEHDYPDALAYDCKDPFHYFRTAVVNGNKRLIVGGCDHKTGHHSDTEQIFAQLASFVKSIYPVKNIDYQWSAQYYEPADGLPYIGHLPGADDHIYVATGFSGNGMTFGTLSATILCDLICTGESVYKKLFAPSRIKPIAGFSNFMKENADVLKHFVADRISIKDLEGLDALSNGEGCVVKYQSKKLAIYKDESGNISALHPVCSHAGCIVQWNSVEKSWDCPCHGARYDTNGKVLTGPAVNHLKAFDIE